MPHTGSGVSSPDRFTPASCQPPTGTSLPPWTAANSGATSTYRLAGAVLHVPPLRARPTEILPLAESFAASSTRELGRPPVELSAGARARLLENPWPGNVRELRNVIERAVLLAREGFIGPEHLACTPAAVRLDLGGAGVAGRTGG